MEAQYDKIDNKYILRYLVFSENTLIITTFLNFFNPEQLLPIVEVALTTKRTQMFYKITVAKLFISSYLNRVDRSIFFLFYEDPEFRNIQNNTINTIASSNYQFLGQAFRSFQGILTSFSERVYFLEGKEEFKSIVETMFFEPDMPMPPMKRQTIGMFCQSPFQHFLALKRFQEEQMSMGQWLQQSLQELKQALESQGVNVANLNDQNTEKLMQTVRFRGWLIDTHTYQDYLIKDFHSHNLIVLLHALSSNLVQTYGILLSNIQDPFMRFVEFNLRSTIYRNIILSIEEKLGFAFQTYDKIYRDIYHPPPLIPKFNFWRSALSIWGQRMSGYHEENRKVYNYITAKLRENSLLGYLSTKLERLPSVYSELRDEAELTGFSEVLKDQAYQATQGGLELESFFENNEEIYQVLAKDYLEYSVDMSINEVTVHMCGHSQHTIRSQPVFDEITASFVQMSKEFYQNLKQKINQTMPIDLKVLTFRQLLKEDIQFIGEFIAKPVTIRKLVAIANDLVKQFVCLLGGKTMSAQQILNKYSVSKDFEEKDKLLTYFASKAEIGQNCDKALQFYYNIQVSPLAEIPKIVGQIESDNSEGEHEVYDSENESI